MGVTILDIDGVRDAINGRIDTNEWYIIPGINHTANYVIESIEKTYYAGDANGDFDLFTGMFSFGFGMIAVAHKMHMTHKQLTSLLRNDGGQTEGDDPWDETQDIILVCEHDDGISEMQATMFHDWLMEGRH